MTAVSCIGGFSTGSQHAGLRIERRNVAISGMHFHATRSPEFGSARDAYPGIYLGQTAWDVKVTA